MKRISYTIMTGFGYSPEYKLYVPDRFILGEFKKRKGNFFLSGKFSYLDDKHLLDEYFERMNDKSLILARWAEIPNQLVDEVVSCGERYNESKRTLADLTQYSLPAFLGSL